MRSRAPVLIKMSNDRNYLIAGILSLHAIENIRDFDSLSYDTDEAVTQFISCYINFSIV